MQPSGNESEEWRQPSDASAAMPPERNTVDDSTDEPTEDGPVDSSEMTADEPQDTPDDKVLLRWQATEYLHSDRQPVWYIIFGLVVVVLMALAVVVFQSWTFAILIPVMAVALIIYVKRPPATNDYILSRTGLHINDRLFPYSQFKSFGVMSHGDAHSVVLVPRKRFQLGQTLYFPEDVGEPLVDMLAARLPMKEVTPDLVDRLLMRLHL